MPIVTRARLAAITIAVAATACGARHVASGRPSDGRGVSAPATAHGVKPPAVVGLARLFPPATKADVTGEEIEADGSRRYVAQGLRIVERPDGSLEAADTWLPVARNLRALSLPPRLGGGFLFVSATGGSTLLYTAPSWTGALRPLVRLDGEVEQVIAGFDRLYVMLGRGSQWVALDPASGQSLDLGSLPRSAGYGPMAFADEWFGVVVTPFRGALATFDAGATWHPLGGDVTSVMPLEGNVLVSAAGKRSVLDASGALVPLEEDESVAKRPRAAPSPRTPTIGSRLRPIGSRPLETAVLHGFPSTRGTALVAAGGLLARVRLADGAIVEKTPAAYAGVSTCEAVPFGTGPAFVCGEQGRGTSLYVFEAPLSLRLVAAFAEPRRVASSGNGALVVSGGCATERANPSVYCIVPPARAPYEIPVLEPGVERVVALANGGALRLSPPRLGQAGSLAILASPSDERRVALELPKLADKVALGIARDGLWLDSFEEGPDGDVRGWAVGGGAFCGVRVKRNGTVSLGPPQQYLDRALLSGSNALVVTRAGAALETVDGGFDWTDAELPSEPDFKPQRTAGAAHGCTKLGCAFAGWLRVGWGMGPKGRLSIAPPPESTRIRQSAGNRWSLDCTATGEASRPALALPEEAGERESRPTPLAELAPPVRPASERAFDAGSEPEPRGFRAYAWGPPLEAWSKNSRWLLRAVDPYAVDGAVWSTVATPTPWPSPESAADAFGQSTNGPPASLRMVFDARAHAGLFVVNVRGSSELFLVEEGKDIVKLKSSGPTGVVSSFARAGRSSYVGALGEGQTLRIFRIEAGALSLVGDYADVLPRADLPRLSPSTRGDGLALWVRSGNYFLYPLDPRTGALDTPVEIPADALGVMPRACGADEDGYVVGDALSLAPRIDLYGTRFQVGNGIEVRLVVSGSDVCVDGIFAPIGGDAVGSRPPPERKAIPGVPLIVSDPRPGGARRAFRCWD
jgi:hypothetical protein